MSEDKDIQDRHRIRMQRKKKIVDAGIAQATEERGVLLVHTGNGKGKSSSAFGMVARALGHEMRVAVVQFIKGSGTTGEELFYRRFPEVDYHVMAIMLWVKALPGRHKIKAMTSHQQRPHGKKQAPSW